MDDKNIMENMLLTTKGACGLYLNGSIESSSQNVHTTFNTALNDTLCLQDTIYQEMSQKGWYPMQQAQPQQISQVKQQYSNG